MKAWWMTVGYFARRGYETQRLQPVCLPSVEKTATSPEQNGTCRILHYARYLIHSIPAPEQTPPSSSACGLLTGAMEPPGAGRRRQGLGGHWSPNCRVRRASRPPSLLRGAPRGCARATAPKGQDVGLRIQTPTRRAPYISKASEVPLESVKISGSDAWRLDLV